MRVPTVAERHRRLRGMTAALRQAGVKLTRQRRAICAEVVRNDAHPDAATVFRGVRQRLPRVALDTVYRALWLLVDVGAITTLGPPRARVRFDANLSLHHHFLCRICGRASDVYSAALDALTLPTRVKALGRVERTQVEMRGCCLQCLKTTRGR